MAQLTFAVVVAGLVTNLVVVDELDGKTMSLLQGAPVPDGVAVEVGWSYESGAFTPPPIAPPTIEQLTKEFTDAVQGHLDRAVRVRGYDNVVSCASYASSTNPAFAAEAAAAIAWRDAVWAYCYVELGKVVAGERAVPDLITFMGELPELVW